MSLENRMKDACKNMKAPDGMFVIYVWNPSNPEKSIPMEVGEPYKIEGFAIGNARRMNKKWEMNYREANPEQRARMTETDYFVIDDQGMRIS